MALLTLFLLRLCFGLAFGMAITSSKLVTSGYFRNHLYVTLGLASLAALLSRTAAPEGFWYAVAAGIVSYIGAVAWLYEKPEFGKNALLTVTVISMAGTWHMTHSRAVALGSSDLVEKYAFVPDEEATPANNPPKVVDDRIIVGTAIAEFLDYGANLTSGLLLGATMAAMLLGHWYLNAPGMKLAPLRRLLILMGVATALHAVLCGLGLWMEVSFREPATTFWLFIALRWLFGIVGVAAMIVMAWKTLAIPNTQAATGLLYVAVIGAFVGETMSLLLSAESLFPV